MSIRTGYLIYFYTEPTRTHRTRITYYNIQKKLGKKNGRSSNWNSGDILRDAPHCLRRSTFTQACVFTAHKQ